MHLAKRGGESSDVTPQRSGRLALGPAAVAPAGPVVASWLVARLIMVIAWATHGREPLGVAGRTIGLREALLGWDGTFYRRIATEAYTTCAAGDFSCVEVRRFFPLFSMLGRALSAVTPLSIGWSLVVIGNAAAFAAGWVVWRLLLRLSSSAAVASAGVWIVTLFPAAAVMSFGYTEALGVLLTGVVLLAVFDGGSTPWGIVGGVASGLLRPTGVLTGLPAATEILGRWRERRRPPARLFALAVAPLVGTFLFVGFLAIHFDDAMAPLRVQRRLRGGFHEPVSRLAIAAWHTLTVDFKDAYNLAFALAVIAALVLGIVRWRTVIPAGWFVMAIAGLLISLAANNIDSLGRYALAYFPAWVAALALELAPRRILFWGFLGLQVVGYYWFTAASLHHSIIP